MTSTDSSLQTKKRTFSILGDFPGDEALLQELDWCCHAFESPSTVKPPLARLVELLGALPFKARQAVVTLYLASSPHRDAIGRDLFEYCFQPDDEKDKMEVDEEDEDEFVLLANPAASAAPQDNSMASKPLNLGKSHIFDVVIVLMAVSGAAGAEMSRRYLQTASTRYRARILIQCANCFPEHFSSEELYEHYSASPGAVKSKLIGACKQSDRREAFLRKIYEADTDGFHQDLIYWLDSDYVASRLDALVGTTEKPGNFRLAHWGSQGDVYVEYIRRQLKNVQEDQLRLGSVWNHLRNRMELNSMQPRHVHALLEIMVDYKRCYISSHVKNSVKEYLFSQSAKGEDVSKFEVVSTYSSVDTAFVAKLSKKERHKLVMRYFKEKDWDKFRPVSDMVLRPRLPYASYFAAASCDDLWSLLSKHRETNPFLNFLSSTELFDEAQTCEERMKILEAWKDLHLRCKPSDLSAEQKAKYCHGKAEEGMWQMWYDSYGMFYQTRQYRSNPLSDVFSALKEEHRSVHHVNIHIQFVRAVLDLSLAGMVLVSSHLGAREYLDPVLGLLQLIGDSYVWFSKSEDGDAKGLLLTATQTVCNHLIPVLEKTLQFDPQNQGTYVNQTSISFFYSKVEFILDHGWCRSSDVATALASALLNVHAEASKNDNGSDSFVVASDLSAPSKRFKFAYYDYYLHGCVQDNCRQLATRLILDGSVGKVDLALTKRLWLLVCDRKAADLDYIRVCSLYLPNELRDEELPLIVERSTKLIKETYEKSPSKWKTKLSSVAQQLVELKLLEKVLDNEDIPIKVQKTLQVEHGGFANEKARQSLKDETYSAEAGARVEGLTVWLDKACQTDSVSLIAEALKFLVSRVKNESGVHRRTVFTWIQSNFANKVVVASLKDDSADSELHHSLCSAILAMQKNDLSRLDSVGRRVCFPVLPGYILETVLNYDPTRLCLERRQLWINCAIQLHWKMVAAEGDESLWRYTWPQGRYYGPIKLKSAEWVSREAFEALYPTSRASSSSKLAKLRQRVDPSTYLHNNFNPEAVFGPRQCIPMFEKALETVWTNDLPSCALRLVNTFPDDQGVSNALLSRLQFLYRLCGSAWQEVELLTSVFDRIYADLEGATEAHFLFACAVLRVLFEIHGPSGPYTPRLAIACDKLFRRAVAMASEKLSSQPSSSDPMAPHPSSNSIVPSFANESAPNYVELWLSHWRTAYLESGSYLWENPVDDRLQHFLLLHANKGCEPDAWHPTLSTKAGRRERECRMARELLGISPSALLLKDVREVLFKRRQDVLRRYVTEDPVLSGVFSGIDESYETMQELLFHMLDNETLFSCHSDISRRFALYARTEASNSRCDLKSRVVAISKFMSAPSTQHADVLAALQSNLDNAVRESLINGVFALDSPWHILGFLLSQKAIEKNDQRTTSSLLRYVAQHVHVDTVVRVVGLLLKNPRRKKLSFQLHKATVRMLFDAKTPEASQLLRAEWANDLSEGVRSMMAETCVHSVADGETEGWEATVLADIASNPAFEPDLKFCLLAPASPMAGNADIPRPDEVEADELLDHYRLNGPAAVTPATAVAARKFRSILEVLEASSDGALQLLAKIKKLALSNVFLNPPCDGQGAVVEMLECLTRNLDGLEIDHKMQVERSCVSFLFAAAVHRLLNNALRNLDGNASEAVKLCDGMHVVRSLKDCLRVLLDAALNLPVRKQRERALLLKSLDTVMNTLQANVHGPVFKHVVIEPFRTELRILKKDAGLLKSVFRHSSL